MQALFPIFGCDMRTRLFTCQWIHLCFSTFSSDYCTTCAVVFWASFFSSSVGHGRSEGDRVHVETFDTYVLDVIQHVEKMKREYSDIPCLLMGHSMVSMVVYTH